MNLKFHIKIALGYFFIVALLGVFLRMFQVVDINFNYKNILHAHSHIALLGWIYTAITTLIYQLFLSNKQIEISYKRLFWSTQISILGMLFTFPFTGYALFSILFSTYFLLNSYAFIRLFLKHTTIDQKKSNSYKLARASLWLMVLSSLGPWALGGIMNTLGSTSSWYRNAIYFYLHFQYNGWFIVALIGILFFIFEKHSILISKKSFSLFYNLFLSGVFLTFFLSVLWMKPAPIFYIFAGIGSGIQLLAFGLLLKLILQRKSGFNKLFSNFERFLLNTVCVLLTVKIIVQLLGAIPILAEKISSNIDLVIAYLHWIFLGIITITLFVFLKHFKLMMLSKKSFAIYLVAFILTEALLFYKSFVVWVGSNLSGSYYQLLFMASAILFLVITILFVQQYKGSKTR